MSIPAAADAPAVLVERIFELAAAHPDKPAVICAERCASYSTLEAKIRSAATFLRSQGVNRGDRVVLSATSANLSFVYGYYACHMLGAVAVPVETKISERQLEEIIAQTDPRVLLLGDPGFYKRGGLRIDSLDGDDPGERGIARVGLDETSDILFTAGTTGRPKGVMQSARNILAFIRGRNDAVGAAADDRIVIPVPLSHGFGLGRLRATLYTGGTAILVYGFLFPGRIFEAFERYAASAMCCIPTGFAALFELTGDKLGDYGRQLKYVETATSPLPAAIRKRLLDLLPSTKIFNSYGSTETTSSIAFAELNAGRDGAEPVGKPVPGVELRIAGAPAGAPGRVLVKGENVMKGYWRDPERTAAALCDGWLAMNDIGFLDSEGLLYLTGRLEDLLNVGGLKVSPAEIELALKEHPAIQDCACVGIEDPAGLTGEVAKAFLVMAAGTAKRPGHEELVDFLRRRLEPHKIPSEFEWISSVPRSAMGKVLRNKLRHQ